MFARVPSASYPQFQAEAPRNRQTYFEDFITASDDEDNDDEPTGADDDTSPLSRDASRKSVHSYRLKAPVEFNATRNGMNGSIRARQASQRYQRGSDGASDLRASSSGEPSDPTESASDMSDGGRQPRKRRVRSKGKNDGCNHFRLPNDTTACECCLHRCDDHAVRLNSSPKGLDTLLYKLTNMIETGALSSPVRNPDMITAADMQSSGPSNPSRKQTAELEELRTAELRRLHALEDSIQQQQLFELQRLRKIEDDYIKELQGEVARFRAAEKQRSSETTSGNHSHHAPSNSQVIGEPGPMINTATMPEVPNFQYIETAPSPIHPSDEYGHYEPRRLNSVRREGAVNTFYCWLTFYLLSSVSETTNYIPKILGFKPALDETGVSYTECADAFILNQGLDNAKMSILADKSFGNMITVISRLLVCEEALKERGYNYSQHTAFFLIHEELDQMTIEELVEDSAATDRPRHMKIPKNICSAGTIESVLDREGLEYIETESQFIIQGVLSMEAITTILDYSNQNLTFFESVQAFAGCQVVTHLRTDQTELLLTPRGSFDAQEVIELGLQPMSCNDEEFDTWMFCEEEPDISEIIETLKTIGLCSTDDVVSHQDGPALKTTEDLGHDLNLQNQLMNARPFTRSGPVNRFHNSFSGSVKWSPKSGGVNSMGRVMPNRPVDPKVPVFQIFPAAHNSHPGNSGLYPPSDEFAGPVEEDYGDEDEEDFRPPWAPVDLQPTNGIFTTNFAFPSPPRQMKPSSMNQPPVCSYFSPSESSAASVKNRMSGRLDDIYDVEEEQEPTTSKVLQQVVNESSNGATIGQCMADDGFEDVTNYLKASQSYAAPVEQLQPNGQESTTKDKAKLSVIVPDATQHINGEMLSPAIMPLKLKKRNTYVSNMGDDDITPTNNKAHLPELNGSTVASTTGFGSWRKQQSNAGSRVVSAAFYESATAIGSIVDSSLASPGVPPKTPHGRPGFPVLGMSSANYQFLHQNSEKGIQVEGKRISSLPSDLGKLGSPVDLPPIRMPRVESRAEKRHVSQLLPAEKQRKAETKKLSKIADVYRPVNQPSKREPVKEDTVFVSVLVKDRTSTQLYRISLQEKESDDMDLSLRLSESYYGVRGWYKQLLFKGIADVKTVHYEMLPIPYKTQPEYFNTTLSYTPISIPTNFIPGQGAINNLLSLLKHPRNANKETKWLSWVGGLQGSRPVRKQRRSQNGPVLSTEVYEPSLETLKGVGLLFVEGWDVARIFMTLIGLVSTSIMAATALAVVKKDIETAVLVGEYGVVGAVGLVAVLVGATILDGVLEC